MANTFQMPLEMSISLEYIYALSARKRSLHIMYVIKMSLENLTTLKCFFALSASKCFLYWMCSSKMLCEKTFTIEFFCTRSARVLCYNTMYIRKMPFETSRADIAKKPVFLGMHIRRCNWRCLLCLNIFFYSEQGNFVLIECILFKCARRSFLCRKIFVHTVQEKLLSIEYSYLKWLVKLLRRM